MEMTNNKYKLKLKRKFEHVFLQLFYFQVRESPAPLNIPTSTPAPDRGGPVACLGGAVAYLAPICAFVGGLGTNFHDIWSLENRLETR